MILNIDTNICFECGTDVDIHQHHIIPKSLGGTKTIPLCNMCHGKAHNKNNGIHKNPNELKRLAQLGRERFVSNGGKLGRKVGAIETIEKFISKPRNQEVKRMLEAGMTVRKISSRLNISSSTVVKMRKVLYSRPEAKPNPYLLGHI
jgi:transposase-like protein